MFLLGIVVVTLRKWHPFLFHLFAVCFNGRFCLFEGFMCGTNVLDKDGISACVVTAELACYLAQNGVTLTQQLENIFNKYVNFIMLIVIFFTPSLVKVRSHERFLAAIFSF
jgi:phosphomannomutase